MTQRLLAFLFLLFTCRIASASEPGELLTLFGGAENVQLIRDASRADACFLRYVPPPPRPDGSVDRTLEQYEETEFVSLEKRALEQVRDLLLNPQTYAHAGHTGNRQAHYRVRLRFHHETGVVAVDFCFPCQVLRTARDGKLIGGASFAGNADLLTDHFARIFPADEALREANR